MKGFSKILIMAFLSLICSAAVFSENEITKEPVFDYGVSLDYTWDPFFSKTTIPADTRFPSHYTFWDMHTAQTYQYPGFLGLNGHLFHLTSDFEWIWGKVSLSGFGGLTLNYVPSYIVQEAFLIWMNTGAILGTTMLPVLGLLSPLGPLGVLLLLPVGIIAFVSNLGQAVITIPPTTLNYALPMLELGGSFDYHPYKNDWLDTKLSIGLDIDIYRSLTTNGGIGLFAEGRAKAGNKQFNAFIAGGYRLDVINTFKCIRDNTPYIPEPYVKGGITFRGQNHK